MQTDHPDAAYQQFVAEVKKRIRQAQYQALKAVNKEQIQLYWELGRLIVERQQQHAWGKSIVENLARELHTEFAGMSGMSSANLWRMRAFYLTYHQDEKLAPLVREISWSHNIAIMEKCKDDHEGLFYVQQTRRNASNSTATITGSTCCSPTANCGALVGVELKIDEFRPEYAGKMNFYLSLLNGRLRKPHEAPSIGIIICKSKSRTTVEFALQDVNKPIGVATYTLSPQLPDSLSRFFPSSEELIRRIEAVSAWLNK
jgi:predicted nuclease of restriction endonuclease-like (RecB) superfamily